MEKGHNVTAEQAISMVIDWLNGVEVRGHKNISAMDNALTLLSKVREFVHEEPKPEPVEPVVELEPVEDPDQNK